MCSALALHCSSEANCPHPTLRASKAQLGLLVLSLPSHAGWEHLPRHMGFAELPKWGKRQPKEKQGHRARGTDPCSAFSSITWGNSVLGWKRIQRLSSAVLKIVSNTQRPFLIITPEQSRTSKEHATISKTQTAVLEDSTPISLKKQSKAVGSSGSPVPLSIPGNI